jgi:flavin reductase (DIM6/NTAB) family NADH-FMN oxidoreductase RutF
MTIHTSNPFATEPDPVRRFRGRLGGAVSLWTSGAGQERAGLTVSSVMVANGDPGRVLGLLDPDASLAEVLERTGLAVVQLLTWEDRRLADAFGGVAPAPGGPVTFGQWIDTSHGPVLSDVLPPGAAGGFGDDRVLALAWTGLREDDRTLQAGLKLAAARDWPGFVAALRDFTAVQQNVLYADVTGRIGFYSAGRVPVRAVGDAQPVGPARPLGDAGRRAAALASSSSADFGVTYASLLGRVS